MAIHITSWCWRTGSTKKHIIRDKCISQLLLPSSFSPHDKLILYRVHAEASELKVYTGIYISISALKENVACWINFLVICVQHHIQLSDLNDVGKILAQIMKESQKGIFMSF